MINSRSPLLFRLMRRTIGHDDPLFLAGMTPKTPTRLFISGVTKDGTGAILPGCSVDLLRTVDDLLMERTTSDGSGNYSFVTVGVGEQYYVVAYLAGSPDVAGTTRNDLIGT
jgi:hypothetical protein